MEWKILINQNEQPVNIHDGKKVNLGCGYKKFDGWINIDMDKACKPDIIADISQRVPLPDNSVSEVYINHVIEHLDDRLKALEEIYRICKNGAKITIITPYRNNIRGIDHKGDFDESTFSCLDYHYLEKTEYSMIKTKIRFKLCSISVRGDKRLWFIFFILPFGLWRNFTNFVINEMKVIYEVIK